MFMDDRLTRVSLTARSHISAVLRGAVFAVSILALADADPARSDEIADFYAAHPIKIIVGTGPGGGYDIYARLIARYLARYVPGKPKVITVNMPGASSLNAANYLANVAPKDGTEILLPVQTLPLAQVSGNTKARFDLSRFNWIGNMSNSANTIFVWRAAPVKTIEDAVAQEVTMGATTPSSLGGIYPAVLNGLLGTRFKIINGYESGDAIDLALERGEIEGRAGTSWAALKAYRPDWLREGKIRILAQVGMEREADLDAPLLTDFAKDAAQRETLRFFSSFVAVGRALAMGPGVPERRVAVLREAFERAIEDPELRAEAMQQRLELRPEPGQRVQQTIAFMVRADARILAYAPALVQDLK